MTGEVLRHSAARGALEMRLRAEAACGNVDTVDKEEVFLGDGDSRWRCEGCRTTALGRR